MCNIAFTTDIAYEWLNASANIRYFKIYYALYKV